MELDRRNFLLAAATSAAPDASRSALGYEKPTRVLQSELDEAIDLHDRWLSDNKVGQRCTFAYRDLSGLLIGGPNGVPVNLSGADFTQADLSGTEAYDIWVPHCSFNGATFDGCRWRKPVFAYSDMRRASAKAVKWGTRHRGPQASDRSPTLATPRSTKQISPTQEYMVPSTAREWVMLVFYTQIYPTANSWARCIMR